IKVTASNPGSPNRFTGAAFNAFSLGYMETGTGADYQIASIKQSSAESGGAMLLRLARPLQSAVTGQSAVIYMGCDGATNTCRYVFNNYRRNGSHVVPLVNPALNAIQPDQSNQNKK